VVGIASLRFRAADLVGCGQAVQHADGAGLAVEFEEDFDFTIFVHVRHGLQTDFQDLAGVDLGHDLFTRLHAVKERSGRQGADWAIGSVASHVIKEDLGIHQIAVQILVIDGFAFKLRRQVGTDVVQMYMVLMLARTVDDWFVAF